MEKVNGVNFRAIPLYRVKIKKFDTKSNKFISVPAKFVMLDSTNKNDLNMMDSISEQWKDALYINEIRTAANWMNKKDYIKIYALTEQDKNFEELNPKKILGVAEMREEVDIGNELSHLQVKPTAININSDANNYKKIGSSIIKSLQRIYDQIALVSIRDNNIETFYKEHGFIEIEDAHGNFVWNKNILTRLKLFFESLKSKIELFLICLIKDF